MQWTDFYFVLAICQTNKEGDGAHRVGNESDVLNFVEARIDLSLADLATGTGDDVKVCVGCMGLCRPWGRSFFASVVA